MPATISITGAMAFAGNYQSFQSLVDKKPVEGPRSVPVSMTWSTDAQAPNYALDFNLQQAQNTLPITQIASLYVDNLSNDADAFFYFPDTQFRLAVPASSVGVYPIITNGLRFTAYSPQASDGDQTFVQILNFNLSPFSTVKTEFVTNEGVKGVAIPQTVTPTNTVLYTGAGDIRAISMNYAGLLGSAPDTVQVLLTDGVGGTLLWVGTLNVSTTELGGTLVDLSGLDIPFQTSVVLNLNDIGGHVTSGTLYVNVYVSHK